MRNVGHSVCAGDAARRWLILAVAAVAASGVFAILIALARVPALGTLFPGAEFYRVALTLHVNLSQGVWFMAFAGVLWSLASSGGRRPDALALVFAACGTLGIILSVSGGGVRPVMSNYLPVLDSALFLASLTLFGCGVLIKAATSAVVLPSGGGPHPLAVARALLLRLSALEVVAVFGLLGYTALRLPAADGLLFFEPLFWGPGHLWQFALVSLLMVCWLDLAPAAAARLPRGMLPALVAISAVPVVLALAVPFFHAPDSTASAYAYTWLMQWTSWQAPLLLGVALLACGPLAALAPGFLLSLLLFVVGLLLGALIDGQTTLVTAHYHGTIGAITLAFMALSFRILAVIGIRPPAQVFVRWQLGFYGWGVLLMMAGLAGAGLMGAPRKTPGELGMTFGIETVSRIFLGIGGLCATVGIVMFAVLLLRRLFPDSRVEVMSA
jgi:hypothetical protein